MTRAFAPGAPVMVRVACICLLFLSGAAIAGDEKTDLATTLEGWLR